MAISNSDYVERIFNAILMRSPSDEESEKWTEELKKELITPAGLLLAGSELTEFLDVTLPLAQTYLTIFGTIPTRQEMLFWGSVYRSGASIEQIAESFVFSESFKDELLKPRGEIISDIYQNATGSSITTGLLREYEAALDNGDYSAGELLVRIAMFSDPLEAGLGIVHSALFDTAPTRAEISTLPDDSRDAVAEIFSQFEQQNSSETPDPEPDPVDPTGTYESEGQLILDDGLSGSVTVDLQSRIVTNDDNTVALTSGSLSNVSAIDARALTSTVLNISGSNNHDIIYASAAGNTIRGYDGNDTITLNDGIDTVAFEANTSDNGVDTIYNFQIGDDGDKLEFTLLLNVPDARNAIVTADEGEDNVNWDNGDILVVSGHSLNSSAEIAQLFSDGTFRAPDAASKSVVISAGITGDAYVWKITNATNVDTISSSEIAQIATLKNINNLSLLPFSEDNFVTPASESETPTDPTPDPDPTPEPTGTFVQSGQLNLASDLSGTLTIDIQSNIIKSGADSIELTSGSLSSATQLDARSFDSLNIDYTGNAQTDTYYASGGQNTIRGSGGDDTLTLNDGQDTLVFETELSTNGIDTINNFQIGTGGDILDFSNLLNVPDNSQVATAAIVDTTQRTWNNGDILVVSGTELTTSASIAALFTNGSTNGTFAAPNGLSKAVVITASVIGDAAVWHIVNDDATGNTIEADEVTQVATLTGINNLTLQGFVTDNFAT